VRLWRRDVVLAITLTLVVLALGAFVVYPLVMAIVTPRGEDWLRAVTTPGGASRWATR
jgi:hypothetical protein